MRARGAGCGRYKSWRGRARGKGERGRGTGTGTGRVQTDRCSFCANGLTDRKPMEEKGGIGVGWGGRDCIEVPGRQGVARRKHSSSPRVVECVRVGGQIGYHGCVRHSLANLPVPGTPTPRRLPRFTTTLCRSGLKHVLWRAWCLGLWARG